MNANDTAELQRATSRVMSPLEGLSLDLGDRNPPMKPTAEMLSIKGKHAQVIYLDPRRVEPLPFNPRKRNSPGFTPESLRALGASIKKIGQQQACLVCRSTSPDFDAKLVDGERRFLACKLGEMKLKVVVNDNLDPNDEETLHALSVANNFNREPHTSLEVAHAVSRMKNGAKLSAEEIATVVGRTAAWVYQHLSLLKLHPEVQEMLVTAPTTETKGRKKRSCLLSFNVGLKLSDDAYSHDDQLRFAKEIITSEMSDAEAFRFLDNERRKRGLPLKSLEGQPGRKFSTLQNLADKAEHTFGRYIDMTDPEVNKMISNQSPEVRSNLAKKIRIVGTSLLGLANLVFKEKAPSAGD